MLIYTALTLKTENNPAWSIRYSSPDSFLPDELAKDLPPRCA